MQFKNLILGCAVGLSLLAGTASATPTCVATRNDRAGASCPSDGSAETE